MKFLDGALAVMVGMLVLDVLLGVASRYLWGAQVKWTEELATLLLVYVSIFGIAAAFDRCAHLAFRLKDKKTACTVRSCSDSVICSDRIRDRRLDACQAGNGKSEYPAGASGVRCRHVPAAADRGAVCPACRDTQPDGGLPPGFQQ